MRGSFVTIVQIFLAAICTGYYAHSIWAGMAIFFVMMGLLCGLKDGIDALIAKEDKQ